jgi:hypothetical protein
MYTLTTPYRYPVGIGVSVTIKPVAPSLWGVGYDHESRFGVHQALLGIGVGRLFVTVGAFRWDHRNGGVRQ